ncbi:MAG: AI-2E family transporter [Oscillospiraceae bacterium]|nr:AI-2E family transporter [Oscillospiraceae bacterium]
MLIGFSSKGRDILKIDFNKKYNTISVYCIFTFAVCLALVILYLKSSVIGGYISEFFRVVAPVTWGVVIAYICNPLMKFFERVFAKLIERKKPHPKINRCLSIAVSLILLIAIIASLLTVIIIQVRDSVMEILNNIPNYINQLEVLITKWLGDYPEIVNYFESQLETIQPKLIDYANNMLNSLGDLSVKLKDGAIGFLVAIKDFVIGFIVAIYLLYSKETFAAQARKIVYAIFPRGMSKTVLRISSKANYTLSGFISGKLLDSLIIGILCFICMSIMKMEFVALISVIVGVTNIIPFFGPFFGAIPSAFLLLITAPKQVIPFVIFILILQQFDGNILGPKILGDSTGLTPFWVMFAIFVGGGLFGFAGMVLGVPVFAVIYALISESVAYLLKRKRLSHRTKDYIEFDISNPPAAVTINQEKAEVNAEEVSAAENTQETKADEKPEQSEKTTE